MIQRIFCGLCGVAAAMHVQAQDLMVLDCQALVHLGPENRNHVENFKFLIDRGPGQYGFRVGGDSHIKFEMHVDRKLAASSPTTVASIDVQSQAWRFEYEVGISTEPNRFVMKLDSLTGNVDYEARVQGHLAVTAKGRCRLPMMPLTLEEDSL